MVWGGGLKSQMQMLRKRTFPGRQNPIVFASCLHGTSGQWAVFLLGGES
jgi:hypothetical protein